MRVLVNTSWVWHFSYKFRTDMNRHKWTTTSRNFALPRSSFILFLPFPCSADCTFVVVRTKWNDKDSQKFVVHTLQLIITLIITGMDSIGTTGINLGVVYALQLNETNQPWSTNRDAYHVMRDYSWLNKRWLLQLRNKNNVYFSNIILDSGGITRRV